MNNKLICLIIISIITRIFSIYLFGAKEISNEWGVMVSVMEENQMIGFRKVEGEVMPNIFMPPLYPIFLFLVKKLFSNLNYYLLTIQFIQLIFSIIGLIYLIKILSNFFSEKISYIGAYIFALFPLNVYAISQISSVTLQILLMIFYIYFFIKCLKISSKKNTILFSLFSACLILLRGEFFVFYFFTLFYFFLKKKIHLIISSFIITLLLISPYLIRNYLIFEVITVTKSAGFNLFKGNNPLSKAEGIPMLDDVEKISKETHEKIKKIKPQDKYDLIIDGLYKEEAIKFIMDNPIRYTQLYIIKLISFIFFDFNSSYPNYYNIFHLLPKIIISISSLIGVFLTLKSKDVLKFFALYYLLNGFLLSIFFILPRYSLALLPIQIILTCYSLSLFRLRFLKTN
jgi:hypothetical protein